MRLGILSPCESSELYAMRRGVTRERAARVVGRPSRRRRCPDDSAGERWHAPESGSKLPHSQRSRLRAGLRPAPTDLLLSHEAGTKKRRRDAGATKAIKIWWDEFRGGR